MKKFEIIKDKWIRKVDYSFMKEAIKINSISFIRNEDHKNDGFNHRYSIFLSGDKNSLLFFYKEDEEKQYSNDLTFFENLFYNQQ